MSDAPVPSKARWYALHVRSNQERNTSTFLTDRDVEHFLPLYRVRSVRRDRRVTLDRPLFTGYLFVHIDLMSDKRVQVLKAPGTVRLVGFGDAPNPVPDETIESIRILVGDRESVRPHPLVRVGRPVRVTDGPFAGAVGVLAEMPGKRPRLVVEIGFLGRAVAVPINTDQLQPVL